MSLIRRRRAPLYLAIAIAVSVLTIAGVAVTPSSAAERVIASGSCKSENMEFRYSVRADRHGITNDYKGKGADIRVWTRNGYRVYVVATSMKAFKRGRGDVPLAYRRWDRANDSTHYAVNRIGYKGWFDDTRSFALVSTIFIFKRGEWSRAIECRHDYGFGHSRTTRVREYRTCRYPCLVTSDPAEPIPSP